MLRPIIALENWGKFPIITTITRDYSLSDLEERLVIDWGGSTLSWCQSRLDKDVVKILQIEQKVFPGYEKVILKFGELKIW